MGAPNPIIGQTLGHYRVLEQIGAGGMGLVFRAHDERLDRDVALKVLPPGTLSDEQARKRFRKEALALSQLNHPNIETVHDFDTQEGVDFLVMELIPGVTLNERLRAGSLSEPEVCRLGTHLAQGLAAAHEHSIIHRDLKPGNLRLMPDGRLKILDFGLAKLLGPATPDVTTESLSQTHGAVGTLPYMAPEQLRGQPADVRTDIWAAGCVLYEMATGRRPFPQTGSAAMVTDAILHQDPLPPSKLNARLSTKLERLILKALAKEPGNRHQSASELYTDLERTGAKTQGLPRQRKKRPRKVRIHSLVVLPLANLSRDPEQDYFAEGMTEALITYLAKIGALRVISRTSAMRYKGTAKPLAEIAGELDVDAVVEGSILRSGERVRITAQLIHAATDSHLWAESYERDLRDVLALQSEVARAIASEIQIKLTPQDQARLGQAGPVNPKAHEAYLKGRYYSHKFSPDSLRRSLECFEEAIRADPAYAPAYAGLAQSYASMGFVALPTREVYAKTTAAARKALQLDETLAEAHLSLGYAKLVYDWDWGAAEAEFQRALELNPGSATAHYHYSTYLSVMERHAEAIAEAQRALELDPLSPLINTNLAWRYQIARQYDQAIAQFQKTLALDPNFAAARGNLGLTYVYNGMYEQALAEFEKMGDLGSELWVQALHVEACAAAGKIPEAQRIASQLQGLSKESGVSPYWLAAVHAALGEKEQALAYLERACEERDSWMIFLEGFPRFDSLRPDPRFQDLLRRVGLTR